MEYTTGHKYLIMRLLHHFFFEKGDNPGLCIKVMHMSLNSIDLFHHISGLAWHHINLAKYPVDSPTPRKKNIFAKSGLWTELNPDLDPGLFPNLAPEVGANGDGAEVELLGAKTIPHPDARRVRRRGQWHRPTFGAEICWRRAVQFQLHLHWRRSRWTELQIVLPRGQI